jgi:hypothetical protein
MDFVRDMQIKGKSGSHVARFRKVLLSWLSYNNVYVRLKVKIKVSESPRTVNERVPSKKSFSGS